METSRCAVIKVSLARMALLSKLSINLDINIPYQSQSQEWAWMERVRNFADRNLDPHTAAYSLDGKSWKSCRSFLLHIRHYYLCMDHRNKQHKRTQEKERRSNKTQCIVCFTGIFSVLWEKKVSIRRWKWEERLDKCTRLSGVLNNKRQWQLELFSFFSLFFNSSTTTDWIKW